MKSYFFGASVRKKLMRLFYLFFLLLFLEIGARIILTPLVDKERLIRFDRIFLEGPGIGLSLPHPYLNKVPPTFLSEQIRLLEYRTKGTDVISIVALGGSTTESGYPFYTERYLNNKFKEIGLQKRAIVVNFGVGGWTSLDSLQAYVYLVRHLNPDYMIITHNSNERSIDIFHQYTAVLFPPLISSSERKILQRSHLYRQLKMIYFMSYNHIRYGSAVVLSNDPEIPLSSRISSYLNSNGSEVITGEDFFRYEFFPKISMPLREPDYWLAKSYQGFIKYTAADNISLILTTQYLNYSKNGPYSADEAFYEHMKASTINEFIRNVSTVHNIPLVDLDREMRRYDAELLDDGIHFTERGIQLKGELVGAAIWNLLVNSS